MASVDQLSADEFFFVQFTFRLVVMFAIGDGYRGAYAVQHLFVDYMDVPFYVAILYLASVSYGVKWMESREPFRFTIFLGVWNLALAVFSLRGATVLVPPLIETWRAKGTKPVLCHLGWWYDGEVGMWVMLFALSKIPELFDTLFLILQKKPVIFLHWYHHVTVMLYCWLAYPNNATGATFAAMNYVVHTVMYGYYFCTAIPWARNIARSLSKWITALQLVQMVAGLGLVCATRSFMNDQSSDACPDVGAAGNRAALMMYASYFVLFAKFFSDRYRKTNSLKDGAKQK